MSHYWLLITLSWLGTVRLQYINTAGPAEGALDSMDSNIHFAQPPFPLINYLTGQDYDTFQIQDNPMTDHFNQFYQREDIGPDLERKRRKTEDGNTKDKPWLPNLIDTDKTTYLRNDDRSSGPFVIHGFSGVVDENGTEILDQMEKKSFSPWGGKRANIENTWTYKRAANMREPSMPKRVRFSPWGGKRSGQMVYKPGGKGSKILFSTYIPELTRIVSNYMPKGEQFNLAGLKYSPVDKRHPISILTLSTKMDEDRLRDALPFKKFLESLPKAFRSGHPYLDVNLKKDGKRKVKFSAWGGKRSPPIIGPIWTPAPQDLKESTLNAILLIRNSQDKEEATKKL